jgi:class 3 adenylate cyclase/tetratricopeptide (TPR) repeat protein
LCHLTADDLEGLGVATIGHRRQLLVAIARLRDDAASLQAARSTDDRRASTSVAERRQITVLFCDIVGSTPLSTGLDPEELREILTTYQTNVAAAVTGERGYIARFVGDGVLAYFGWPNADEAHVESAVRAGLAIVEAVGPQRLSVRIGIATGLVVTGDLVGVGAAQTMTAVGETPNLAARLQSLAQPNTIVVSDATRSQLGHMFDLEDLGLHALKGFETPVRPWRVLRKTAAASRSEVVYANALTPLVDREEELGLLLRRWHEAKAGEGRVVLLSGEAGIGKSRLLAALEERLAGEPHSSLHYFCSPHHQDSPLSPLIARLEREAGFIRGDTPADRLAKLEAALAPTKPPPEDVALFAALLLIPTDGRYPLLELSPQQRKMGTFAALLRRLSGLARREPVLFLFEDAHWSDPSSVELLEAVVEQVPDLPVLLVVSFRPEFVAPWFGRARVSLMTLSRLDRQDARALATQIVKDHGLTSQLLDRIVMQSDGVPLFIEELSKAVLETSELETAGTTLAVPDTLQASLMARLDRLPAAKTVAQIGSVIGREFSHALLAAAAGLHEAQLTKGLHELVAAGLLFRRGAPPDAVYTFKHALVQDAAYSTLLRGPRQRLHARIAATLEDQFAEIVTTQPALLAQHCAEAGLPEKAVDYWLKAGQQALARSAMPEAVTQLQKGLDGLDGLPDGPWRRQRELDLLVDLLPALAAVKGFSAAEVGETLARGRSLAEKIDRPDHLVPLLFVQWRFLAVRSEHKLALSVAEQIEKIGEARNDVAALWLGHRAHGETHSRLGEFVAARALLERCLGLSDPAHSAVGGALSEDPYATMLAHLAVTLAQMGYIDQARSRLNQALSEARPMNAITRANVLTFANRLESLTHSPGLQQQAEELMALSIERGFPFHSYYAMIFRGRSLTLLGQAKEGLALLTRGLAALRAIGAVLNTPLWLAWLAEAHAMLGQPHQGLKYLAEAAQITETTEERCHEAELYRLRGELLHATGDPSAAESNYHHALTVARSQSARLSELQASASLARHWRQQGKRAEAFDLLASIYNWFTEGLDTPVLEEAKALLEELTQ